MEKEKLSLEAAVSYANINVNDNVKVWPAEDEYTFNLKEPRNGGIVVEVKSGEQSITSEDFITVQNKDDKIIVYDVMISGWREYRDDDPFGLVVENTTTIRTKKEYSIVEKDNKRYLSIETEKQTYYSGTHDSYGGDKGNSSFEVEDLGQQLIEVSNDYKLTDGLDNLSLENETNKQK